MTTVTVNEVETESSNPLKSVSTAVCNASETICSSLRNINITATLSQILYKSSYTLSYGVVYGVVFVAHVFPKNNAVANGLADGARAAVDALADKNAPAQTA